MRSLTTPRLIGEVLGTGLLVFFGVGATIADRTPVAISLLVITVLASWIFRGGHFNPWVTVACAIRGSVEWAAAGVIVVAQFLGGALGGLLMLAVYVESAGSVLGRTELRVLNSGPSYSAGLIAALLAETVAVFLLACVVFALEGTDKLGVGMGLAYAAGAFALADLTGASMNLARTVGPEFAMMVGGNVQTDWSHMWVYLVAGVLGAALAGLLYPLWNRASAKEAKEPAE